MRNITEYPIDYAEAIQYMDSLLDEIEYEYANTLPGDMPCGDMRPLLIDWIKQKLFEQQRVEVMKNG